MENRSITYYSKTLTLALRSYAFIPCILLTGLLWNRHPERYIQARPSHQYVSEAWATDTIPPTPDPVEPKELIRIVESKPQFEGGETALLKYIAANVRYPSQSCVEGKVITQFIVDEKGNVSDEKVVRSIGGGADEEALRVVKMTSGKWKPATRGGVPIKLWFTLPVGFKLDSATGALAPSSDDQIFRVVEEKPEFEGGEAGLLRYFAENIHYPVFNKETEEPQGKVIGTFVVEVNGDVSDVKIIRGSSNEAFNEEVLRAIKSTSGKWKPGKMNGIPVRVQLNIPLIACFRG